MKFVKIAVCWNSPKKDKNGKTFMSGVVDENVTLTKKQKIFVYQTDPNRRGPKSPVATIVVGIDDEPFMAPEPEVAVEPMPEPLPDESDVPF